MSNIVTSGAIYPLLWPGIRKVGLDYKRYENEFKPFFTHYKSTMAQEVCVDSKNTGYAMLKPEGEQTASDFMETTYKYVSVNRQFGLSFAITDWAIENNLYPSEFNVKAPGLANSYQQTQEVMAMNVFNQAFNPTVKIGDGKSLAATDHPYVGGSYANTFVNADGTVATVDFSETAIEQAIIQIGKFKDQAGMLINAKAKYLLLPTNLEFSGCRLLKSMYRVGTANNDINAIYNLKAISGGYRANNFLTSPSNYFITTDIPNTLMYYDRMPFKMDMTTNPDTKTVKISCVGAYSFMPFTANGVFCAKGA